MKDEEPHPSRIIRGKRKGKTLCSSIGGGDEARAAFSPDVKKRKGGEQSNSLLPEGGGWRYRKGLLPGPLEELSFGKEGGDLREGRSARRSPSLRRDGEEKRRGKSRFFIL